jgi:hypothetical protein
MRILKNGGGVIEAIIILVSTSEYHAHSKNGGYIGVIEAIIILVSTSGFSLGECWVSTH